MHRLDEAVLRLEREFLRRLEALVVIPSVKAPPSEGMPFGRPMADCLKAALDISASDGLVVRDFDGYAGDATTPEGEGVLGILCHLDVVPAGEGWSGPPFMLRREGDRLVGRGVADDKGGTVAAMIALKAVREAGIPLKKKVRLIYGCDEESGWACMRYYMPRAGAPDVGFAPDAGFPMIYAERGITHIEVTCAWEEPGLVSLCGGVRANVLPDAAEAVLCGEGRGAALMGAWRFEGSGRGGAVSAREEGETVVVQAAGTAAHAAFPESGDNAVAMLCRYLAGYLPGAAGGLELLARAGAWPGDGAALGVDARDEPSGALTCNLGILKADARGFAATLDIRYPVTMKEAEILARVGVAFAPLAPQLKVVGGHGPLYVPVDAPLPRALLKAYRDVTCDTLSQPIAMGGGTYARSMPNCVAFGPGLPKADEEDGGKTLPVGGAHQANESALLTDLLTAARIYARAIVALAG